MLKRWISCLLLLGSGLTLMAQTESGLLVESEQAVTANTPYTGLSWLEGGAGDGYEQSPALPYAPLREADVLWEKRVWRVIDTREKMNLTFRHPEYALFNVLLEGYGAGALNVYHPEDDRFSRRMTADELNAQLYKTDTVLVTDPVTLETKLQVVSNAFDPETIQRWRVQEVWYFDTRYSRMDVRIIGIAPMVENTIAGMEGTVFETPLFWINFTEARQWLAQHPSPGWGNDRSRSSWEDLFIMRRFHSYVYQQSDMRGRRLQDYVTGQDLLLESGKIDQGIQSYEMDMWSY